MISVIIPTYNREKVIKKSIQSILNQTYKDIEIIIVDDNSTDNTADIIKEFDNSKIRYYRLKENRGACFARNYGIERANGEYIAFQDSDDEWHGSKLEKQLDYLLFKNLDIISCKIKIIGENNKIIFPKDVNLSTNNIYIDNKISTQTILGKKQCFLNVKFDENLPRFQDWDLAINLVKKFKVEVLDEVLVDVYMQDNSISKNPEKAVKALKIFLEKYRTNKKIEAHYLRLIGVYKLQQYKDTKKYFFKAFIKNPLDKKIIIDLILSVLNLKELHRTIYIKKGRFR